MSTSQPQGSQPFEIIDQTHEELPAANGTMEGEWRIDFLTPSGIHSFIRVPDAAYSASAIHSEIAAKVAEIERTQAGPNG